MALFGKREIIFKTTGDKERWKAARAALKAAGGFAAGSRHAPYQ